MAGAIIDFTEHTAIAFSFQIHNGELGLDAVVILRCTCPIRDLWLKNPEPPPLIRPTGIRSGGGTTLVGHSIYFDRDSKIVWLNNKQEISFENENVLLIDGAENYGENLLIAGKAFLASTDIKVEGLKNGPVLDALQFNMYLAKALLDNPAIKEFCN